MKQTKNFEIKSPETMCLEIIIAKKEFYFFAQHSPDSNKITSFEETFYYPSNIRQV